MLGCITYDLLEPTRDVDGFVDRTSWYALGLAWALGLLLQLGGLSLLVARRTGRDLRSAAAAAVAFALLAGLTQWIVEQDGAHLLAIPAFVLLALVAVTRAGIMPWVLWGIFASLAVTTVGWLAGVFSMFGDAGEGHYVLALVYGAPIAWLVALPASLLAARRWRSTGEIGPFLTIVAAVTVVIAVAIATIGLL